LSCLFISKSLNQIELKNVKLLAIYLALLAAGVMLMQVCRTYYFHANYQDVNKLLHESKEIQTKPYLKAHLINGGIYILRDTWEVDSNEVILSGNGILYDYNRNKIFEGQISIPIDSVAIFETNQKVDVHKSARIAALTIIAVADVTLGVICFTNPKACFGSCPSFYINEKSKIHYADAEGFSNAISPSLECFDIDALNNHPITGNVFSLTMKNEAKAYKLYEKTMVQEFWNSKIDTKTFSYDEN
jgi:hypothetical protein